MTRSEHGRGILLAVTAGVMAALASTSAKLAMTAEAVHQICSDVTLSILGHQSNESDVQNVLCDSISTLLRLVCFGCIFVFNALMWTFYTKSLQFCTSSIEATVTNTGANFLFTAFVGFFIFQEQLSIKWWLGSCLILTGLLLIHKGSQDTEEQKVKSE